MRVRQTAAGPAARSMRRPAHAQPRQKIGVFGPGAAGTIRALSPGTDVSTAILTNTANRYNRKHPDVASTILATLPGAVHIATRGTAEIAPALERLLADGCPLLVLNGGDGTVQKVLTELLARADAERCPILAILPGGTTNMTARSINGRALSFPQALSALGRQVARQTPPIERRALLAQQPSGIRLAGFFWGMGAILRGIEYCQNTVYGAGIGGEQASGVALVRTVLGIARRQPPFSGGVTVDLEGANPSGRFDASILLATTLEQLFLGIRPFWGTGQGDLQGLLVEEPAHRLVRNLPALLRGRPNRHMTAGTGYHSFRSDALRVTASGRFTLDGELYDFEDGPLALEPSARLRFLRLGSDTP
jgi:diacylglycerol kinase family enzyme